MINIVVKITLKKEKGLLKTILMIINPRAGKNSKRANTGDIVKAFKNRGLDCFEKTTTCRGDATDIAFRYGGKYDAVLCCGGDGTYNEVVNGIMRAGHKTPLIYLPCGSTNDFANTLEIFNDPEKAAQMYVDGLINSFDVGKFNDRYFSYIASFGVGTEISYNTSQTVKNLIGHSAYIINGFVLHIIPIISHLKALHLKIEYDGGVIEDDFLFGAISNTNEVSGIFKFDKCGVKMNDGLLEVLLVKKVNVVQVFGLFGKLLKQDYNDDKMLLFKTDKLKITAAEDIPWTLDGEFGGAYKNMEIEVCKQAVNLVSPKNKFLE